MRRRRDCRVECRESEGKLERVSAFAQQLDITDSYELCVPLLLGRHDRDVGSNTGGFTGGDGYPLDGH